MPRKRKFIRDADHKNSGTYFKGLTLPGYRYLGPFNSGDNGPPTNPSDAAARIHDKQYGQHDSHVRKYLRYSEEDGQFIKAIQNNKDYGASAARAYFGYKRKANEALGYETPLRLTQHGEPTIEPGMDRFAKRLRGSLLNLQGNQDITMNDGDGDGSGNNGTLKETPVDDVYDVHRGPPDYTFSSLPFVQDEEVVNTVSVSDHTFRMTSPYDVRVNYTSTDLNAGAGTAQWVQGANDATDTKVTGDAARWWDLYAGMYDYYHVVSCRWHMTFENLSSMMIWVHQMYHNEEIQPPQATNDDMLCWPDIKSHLLGTHHAAIQSDGRVASLDGPNSIQTETNSADLGYNNYAAGNNITRRAGASPMVTMSGSYTPGQYKRAIHLDNQVENWTAVTTNPVLPERLTFRIKPYHQYTSNNSGVTSDTQMAYRYKMHIEYLVEFKQLKTGLRYPVQRQPLTVTIAQSVSSGN